MSISRINGSILYYEVLGEGPAIIFVHPPVLSSDCFTHQAENLARNFKTVVFDIRGHGKSKPSEKCISYPLIVEDIKQLMDHLNIEKAFLCGYSTGGSVVLQFLLTYPKRSLGAILVGGISEVHDLRLRSRISIGVALAKTKAIRTLALALAIAHSNSSQLFWKTFKDAANGNAQNIEQYYKSSLNFNCTSKLSKINCPVLLVYGKKDKAFHSYGRLLKERLPHSELVYVPKANHRIPIFFWVELNRIIFWFMHEYTK